MFVANSSVATLSFALPVLRVRPGLTVVATIQSSEAFIVPTHWARRRLWCSGEGCPACGLLPARAIAYLVATVKFGPAVRSVLIESTFGQYQSWYDVNDIPTDAILSGVRVEISKAKAKASLAFKACSDVEQILSHLVQDRCGWSTALSGKFPLIASASRIAGLPCPEMDEDPSFYFDRVRPTMSDLLISGMATKDG